MAGQEYQGQGFSGRPMGVGPQPALAPKAETAERPQPSPPVMYCPSCNLQVQWLPNGQLWCSRCNAAVVVEDRTKQAGGAAGRNIMGVIVGIALILGGLWVAGVFDTALAPYGLNFGTCVEMYADGAIYCGDDIPAGFYNFD